MFPTWRIKERFLTWPPLGGLKFRLYYPPSPYLSFCSVCNGMVNYTSKVICGNRQSVIIQHTRKELLSKHNRRIMQILPRIPERKKIQKLYTNRKEVAKKDSLELHHLFNNPSLIIGHRRFLLGSCHFSTNRRQLLAKLVMNLSLILIGFIRFPLCSWVFLASNFLHYLHFQRTFLQTPP